MDRVLVLPPSMRGRNARIDFGGFADSSVQVFADAVIHTLRSELASSNRSTTTIDDMATATKRDLLPWLVTASAALGRNLSLDDIDKKLLESFAADLRLAYTYTSVNIKFGHAMMLVESISRLGYLAPFAEIRPLVQFPGAIAAQEATLPYSKR